MSGSVAVVLLCDYHTALTNWTEVIFDGGT